MSKAGWLLKWMNFMVRGLAAFTFKVLSIIREMSKNTSNRLLIDHIACLNWHLKKEWNLLTNRQGCGIQEHLSDQKFLSNKARQQAHVWEYLTKGRILPSKFLKMRSKQMRFWGLKWVKCNQRVHSDSQMKRLKSSSWFYKASHDCVSIFF